MVLPTKFHPSSENKPAHIPLERGGAAAAASSLLREQRRCWLSPHPSIEGRGSWQGRQVEAERVKVKVVEER